MNLFSIRPNVYASPVKNVHCHYTCSLDRKYRVLISIVCLSVCLSWCVCVSVCLPVCLSVCLCVCVCVYDNSKNNGSINLKLEQIVVFENSSEEFEIWALYDQGQGHGVTLKFFSVYYNTNCQVIYLSFGTC